MSATASEAMAAADEPEVVEPKEEKKKSKKRFKIAGMKINSLRSIAKHFGLGGKGKKKELIDRIEESDVGIDDIKEIAGSELLDSPDKRSCSDCSDYVNSEMTSEDRRMSAASGRDSARSGSRDQTNDNEDEEYEKAKRAVEDSMRTLARSSTSEGKIEETVTSTADSAATETDDHNETALSPTKEGLTVAVVNATVTDTQGEVQVGPVVDTAVESPTKAAGSPEADSASLSAESPVRESTGSLISPQSVASSPHLEKPARDSVGNTDSPLTKEKEDNKGCEQPPAVSEPQHEEVAEVDSKPMQQESAMEVEYDVSPAVEVGEANTVEEASEPVVDGSFALEEQPMEECAEEANDGAVTSPQETDETQCKEAHEAASNRVVDVPTMPEHLEGKDRDEAAAEPIADAAVTSPEKSPPFPLQDRIAKFIDACNSPTDSTSNKDKSFFKADYVKKSSFGESVVVNGEVTDLSAAVSTMRVSENSLTQLKGYASPSTHNGMMNVESTVVGTGVAPDLSEKSDHPVPIEPKTSDLRAQLDNLKARFDKISTPEIREYMVLSESAHSGGVVLSVCDNGDINITKLPPENWKPNFKTFSSFDDVTETVTTAAKAKTPVPARHAHKGLASTHPTPQHHHATTGLAHKNTPASGRRGAMKNMDKSAGVLATFAVEAVADEQKTRHHVAKSASRGHEVHAPTPATPSSDLSASEKKDLSPPVIQPFLALTEEMKSERDDERRRMEKRIGTLHYGRASLGIKISPPRPGEITGKASVPRSPSGHGVRTPSDKREKDRQSSPARMETPLFLPTKTREVKKTPHTTVSRPATASTSQRSASRTTTTTRPGTSVKPATGTMSSRYAATTSSKSVTAKCRIGSGASATVKPRKTPEITRSNTTRTPASTRAPPPSYARSNSTATPGSGGKKAQPAADIGEKSPVRSSMSPVRVHKNPFGAML